MRYIKSYKITSAYFLAGIHIHRIAQPQTEILWETTNAKKVHIPCDRALVCNLCSLLISEVGSPHIASQYAQMRFISHIIEVMRLQFAARA
jgi:hypothetical protein